MRTTVDALRSVKRYTAEVLGELWEVRLWSEQGTFRFPFARVAKTGPTSYASRRVATDVLQAMQIHCYPPPATTVELALEQASALQELLVEGFETGVLLGRPRRIPLYDYDGVPAGGGSMARHPSDHLRVEDFSVNYLPDAQDQTRVAVVADLRVGWSRYTLRPAPIPLTATELRVRQVAS